MPDGLLRRWIEPPPVVVDPGFLKAVDGHPLAAQILARRGLANLDAALAFLNPDQYRPTPPQFLPGIEQACARIELALKRGEPVCVWGDFDVDGQTATTLLVSALRRLGAPVSFHIPVRAQESHGVTWKYLEPLIAGGARLVITCDTGISAHDALAQAAAAGVDVIVTDHHELPEKLPQAHALINPKLVPGEHALSGLPGAGVAYKLAEALYRRAGREAELAQLLDLVALGIVADLAVQTADTRFLLQRGLPVLREARRAGLRALYELAGLQAASLNEENIGFAIGPRLNALGRLDDANLSVEFFTTQDTGRARVLATHLEGLNARRRLLTEQVLRGSLAQIEKHPRLLEEAALVLAHPDWPAGVIGIVASELSERFNRPTILLAAPPGQPARGSARSIEGVNITEAIASQKHLLLSFGGHPMAAGLALDSEHVAEFRSGVAKYVEKVLGGAAPRPTLSVDGQVTLTDLSLSLVSDLERLAPFGPGNPAPILTIPRLTILSSNAVGRDGDHVQVIVKDEQDQLQKVVWWRGAGRTLPEGMFDLACTARTSNYRGEREIQVEWVDARPVDLDSIDLRRRTLTIIDRRGQEHPLPVLLQALAETNAVVWAEGAARDNLSAARVSANVRSQLSPCETLIVWTAPPGRAELQAALQVASPQAVIVFGIDPGDSTPETFLARMAGLVRYAVTKTDGAVELARLAGAAAQREITVRLGLNWLEQRGVVRVEQSAEGLVRFFAPSNGPAPGGVLEDVPAGGLTDQLYAQIKILLEETAAYRQYFQTADKANLF